MVDLWYMVRRYECSIYIETDLLNTHQWIERLGGVVQVHFRWNITEKLTQSQSWQGKKSQSVGWSMCDAWTFIVWKKELENEFIFLWKQCHFWIVFMVPGHAIKGAATSLFGTLSNHTNGPGCWLNESKIYKLYWGCVMMTSRFFESPAPELR